MTSFTNFTRIALLSYLLLNEVTCAENSRHLKGSPKGNKNEKKSKGSDSLKKKKGSKLSKEPKGSKKDSSRDKKNSKKDEGSSSSLDYIMGSTTAEAVIKKNENGMISTTSPQAAEVGAKLLDMGWSAVDVMVAVQSTLGLVEPSASGLGGGAFALYYDANTKMVETWDGREKAPASATGDRFAGFSDFFGAWQSGLSVGVPGVPRLMEAMHQKHGTQDWSTLFDEPIALAENGFRLGVRQSILTTVLLGFNPSCDVRFLFRDPVVFDYFAFPNCTAKPPGTLMMNQDYAETLKSIAQNGAQAFYEGPIAEDIVDAVQNDVNSPGDMTLDDLANYNVVEREPVCMAYKDNNICGMPPPSSGGLAVGQMLGILENFDIMGSPLDIENIHLFTQAGRLAFADRNLYVADDDFVSVPSAGMLDKDYLATRAGLIDPTQDTFAEPGTPPGVDDARGADSRTKDTGTSHISIVDKEGNAISMTTSVEAPFGNGVMVRGFLLNNQLTDFSFFPEDASGNPIANRVAGNKRPRSSMAPTIVLDKDGEFMLATGSPGGSRIIGYTAQSLWNILEFDLDPQEAINVPHYQNRNDATVLEEPSDSTMYYDINEVQEELTSAGHSVSIETLDSGLSIVMAEGNNLVGGADFRRFGVVA